MNKNTCNNPRDTVGVIPRIDQEFKALIPPLAPQEREQLEQNILAKRKCHDAIVLWEGLILDGHNRYEICITHGIEFEVKEIAFASREEAKVWILDNQLGRRNLSDAMRIELVLRKEEVMRKKARKKQAQAGLVVGLANRKTGVEAGEMTGLQTGGELCTADEMLLAFGEKPQIPAFHVRKELAAQAGVGERNIHKYTDIRQHATPELLARVLSGEVKIGTAHRMLTKEILKQLDYADKMYRYMAKSIPPAGLKATNPELYAKLERNAQALEELIKILIKRRKDHARANN